MKDVAKLMDIQVKVDQMIMDKKAGKPIDKDVIKDIKANYKELEQNKSFFYKHKEFLKDIKERTICNEIDLQANTDLCSKICDLISKNCKEIVDIHSLLMETAIPKKLVVEKLDPNYKENNIISNNFDNMRQYSSRLIVYKKLFHLLVEEILNYQTNAIILTQVRLNGGNNIDFIFDHDSNSIIEDFNLNLMRCVIIGLANNIQTQCSYINKQVIINCSIRQNNPL